VNVEEFGSEIELEFVEFIEFVKFAFKFELDEDVASWELSETHLVAVFGVLVGELLFDCARETGADSDAPSNPSLC